MPDGPHPGRRCDGLRRATQRAAFGAALGLFAGAVGGALAGTLESALAGRAPGQYLPTPSGHALFVLFLIAIEGLLGATLGALVGLVAAPLWAETALGRTILGLRARAGTELLAWTLAGAGALTGAGVGISALTLYAEVHYHNRALIAQLVGALSPLILLAAALVAFPAQRLLQAGLMPLRLRVSPRAPLVALGAIALAALTVYAITQRETVHLLDLRPPAALAAFVVGGAAFAAFLRRPPLFGRPLARRLCTGALLLGLLGVTLGVGRSDAVRKAAVRYSAFGGPGMELLRWAADFDRDGYASILGGGDCDDFDARVHPGAIDIPDNGRDENCSGADATLRREPPAPFLDVPAAVPRDPNILLITIDTLRADHLGTYGYGRATSPALDAFAKGAVVFDHAYAHAPSTRYSMPVILTGRYASQVDWDSACPFTGGCATRWPPPLAQSNRLIGEIFKDYGYTTAALLNYRFFEPGSGYNQGFDLYDNGRASLHQGATDPATHGSSSREQADAAIAYLRAHAAEKWFLWVHFYDPHYFYETHPEVTPFGTSELDRYDGEIRFTDLHLARLFAALDELALSDRTLVAVTADHGEGFGEHGVSHHGYHLYNAQTQVPLLLRVPGLAPRRVPEPVGHVDLLPTLVNLIRGRPEPTLVGRTALDLMLGGGSPRHLFQEVMYEGPVTRKTIVTRRWKLVWNVVPDNSRELYDLEADPAETRDRIADPANRATAAELGRTLAEWVERTEGTADSPGMAGKRP
jgi:arylsulfatase A-like enzyme